MKCDLCDNEATVREVTRVKGVAIEKNLCEQCAREQGIGVQPVTQIETLLTHFLTHPPAPVRPHAGTASAACASCGLTFADFKQHGVLGCADCYKAFEAILGPMLERAHEGASHHVGKVPKRASSGAGRTAPPPQAPPPAAAPADERAQRLGALRRQLDEAVRTEQYERAAKIRDEMRRLGDLGVPPQPQDPPRKGPPREK